MTRYTILPARPSHLRALAANLRPGDAAEVAGTGMKARHLIHRLYRESYRSDCALIDGEVAAVWGIQGSALSPSAAMWLLTTPAVERLPLAFFREARSILADVLETKHEIVSAVGSDYTRAIRFFRMLGFQIGAPILSDQGPIRMMTLRRGDAGQFGREPDGPPFVIHSLGRSRSAWLSSFLSYRGWTCDHERSMTMRTPEDLRDFLNKPRTGTSETSAAQAWRLIRHYRPDTRFVVIRRDLAEAEESYVRVAAKVGVVYDRTQLSKSLAYADRCLDQIASLSGTLTVPFDAMDSAVTCLEIFEHCLPYQFDEEWWLSWSKRRVEVNFGDYFNYYNRHRDGVEAFKRLCRLELGRLARAGEIVREIA